MNIKKQVSLLFVIFLSIYLFSEEMSFRCQKTGIPEKAAGTYEINQNQQFIYHSPEGKTYNILSRVDVTGLGITVRKISVRSYELFKYGKDFYTFDDNGNLYFLIEINFLKNGTLYNSSSGVVRFNPLTQKSTCLFAQEKTFPLSFCVSPDGSYLFYAFHSFENTTNYYGYSYVYAIPTKTPTQTEIIWEPYYDYPHIHGIRNLCFDENINALYFTVDGRNDNEDYGNGQGIYRLKADLNGKYKASNTERISCLTFWQLNNLIERTEITKDYKSLEKALKKHCGNFINPDDLEINLSYFKDVSTKLNNGKKYASLYKTDSNGNPLSEEEALKYLLKNRNLLNSFLMIIISPKIAHSGALLWIQFVFTKAQIHQPLIIMPMETFITLMLQVYLDFFIQIRKEFGHFSGIMTA